MSIRRDRRKGLGTLVWALLASCLWAAASCGDVAGGELDRSCGVDSDCKVVATCCMCDAVNTGQGIDSCNEQCGAEPCFGSFGHQWPWAVCNAGTCELRAGCPAEPPTEGDRCGGDPLDCTYGDELQPQCRLRSTCDESQQFTAPAAGACVEPGTSACPASPPAHGSECGSAPVDTLCEYSSAATVCRCLALDCAGACEVIDPPEWRCLEPPATEGCPSEVPNGGSACSDWGLHCDYFGGPCSGIGMSADCQEGVWEWDDLVECPA